jgi:hypothetical protein
MAALSYVDGMLWRPRGVIAQEMCIGWSWQRVRKQTNKTDS